MKEFVSRCKLKRFVALIICFSMLFSFASCRKDGGSGGGNSNREELPGGVLSVPYTDDDSLNPFFVKSVINSALISFIFQGLYYLDAGYKINRELAVSETVSAGSVKVALDGERVFSDGSPLTAEDVVYSFEYARNSALYGVQLEGIAGCESVGDGTVLFRLSYPDVNVLNALTFPIVKRGTATTDSALPVGTGAYKYQQDGIRLSLIYNFKCGGDIPAIGTVRLTGVTQQTALETLVDTGELDFCYSDLSGGTAKRTYSSVSYIYLNNLVFLGVNCESVNMQIADLRKAVSYAIDRQEIVQSGFQGFARSAAVPFNTSWTEVSGLKMTSDLPYYSDKTKAAKLFNTHGAGYEDNMIYLELLCPDNNSFMRNAASVIAKQLSGYFVTVTVKLLSLDEYASALKSGEYDLYMGEVKIPRTMDLSAFFSANGGASYGINTESGLSANAYFRYRSGDISLEQFINVFLGEMPFIPLCYRNGRICFTPEVSYMPNVSEGRIFGDIASWQYAEGVQ